MSEWRAAAAGRSHPVTFTELQRRRPPPPLPPSPLKVQTRTNPGVKRCGAQINAVLHLSAGLPSVSLRYSCHSARIAPVTPSIPAGNEKRNPGSLLQGNGQNIFFSPNLKTPPKSLDFIALLHLFEKSS